MNLASYNYLGFGESDVSIQEANLSVLSDFGASMCSSRRELGSYASGKYGVEAQGGRLIGSNGVIGGGAIAGTCALHHQLENRIASFLRKEAAIAFGMGYATNALTIPVLCREVRNRENQFTFALNANINGKHMCRAR
jgi:serine palmitoyltransferase